MCGSDRNFHHDPKGEKNGMIYLTLFYEFFKVGLFSIGGGMATVPFLMELADRYPWFTRQELANMIAISESTPGPIGINMATYAGYQAAGIPGALTATLSLVFPTMVIIILVAKFMSDFSENKYVRAAFYGIRPMIASLIGYAVWQIAVMSFSDTIAGKTILRFPSILICAAVFSLLQVKQLKKLHPVIWIACGAVLGILFQL